MVIEIKLQVQILWFYLFPLFDTTYFLSKYINYIYFYALEIFCMVFKFSSMKLEYAKLFAKSIKIKNGY